MKDLHIADIDRISSNSPLGGLISIQATKDSPELKFMSNGEVWWDGRKLVTDKTIVEAIRRLIAETRLATKPVIDNGCPNAPTLGCSTARTLRSEGYRVQHCPDCGQKLEWG